MWNSTASRVRLLTIVLRLGGAVTAMAFFAIFLPVDWMAATHEALGLGPFPRAPIVDYLARSIAGLYGFQGVLLLIVSGDPVRYRLIVSYVAILNITFGVMLIAIDLYAGMPMWWTSSEGPLIIVFGIILVLLNRSSAPI